MATAIEATWAATINNKPVITSGWKGMMGG